MFAFWVLKTQQAKLQWIATQPKIWYQNLKQRESENETVIQIRIKSLNQLKEILEAKGVGQSDLQNVLRLVAEKMTDVETLRQQIEQLMVKSRNDEELNARLLKKNKELESEVDVVLKLLDKVEHKYRVQTSDFATLKLQLLRENDVLRTEIRSLEKQNKVLDDLLASSRALNESEDEINVSSRSSECERISGSSVEILTGQVRSRSQELENDKGVGGDVFSESESDEANHEREISCFDDSDDISEF
ncbi:hypothetical protein L596_015205 [Steinernema carpocapsae]|uniref:Uncharacterized protein n=1 Tax=Steinernema carpocapsae TaxID=34508 RepID=A0A4U5NEB0_STECR|nr:hypothetical protein L596_015205 [Steinernema carpocapsae]